MDIQGSSSTDRFIPVSSVAHGKGQQVAADVYCLTTKIVNLCMVGSPGEGNDFVLVDAGMPNSEKMIIKEVEEMFGEGAKPTFIVLTHGHFDHVGALIDLVNEWEVPVFAHELELPYLTGQKSYPRPDSSVEGGLSSRLSFMYPTEPINLGDKVHPLPEDGSVPGLIGWRWIPTPGHSPGHISLFRDSDHFLIAGDAFTTTRQDYLWDVITQDLEIYGPPRYLTTDWEQAKKSVQALFALKPNYTITGHGRPAFGPWLAENLEKLAKDFDTIALPNHGRYVDH
ncbi:MBL fold metallo-hydrolase [Pullulanibacillus sp. KACC 23026]|uniref:MBL fold metallo-hydrolase n=1 Tax=Pullulanibacillus sp. KACC 23026 TaxID=3028315 RepID=UPI0023AFB64D|nr:MBL fold metallo-hydrolase [Pullulanibacillus sp. KACC 23026]WEG13282.1 MBL fold metallo-hydrolase [Pullulanibacillus sp. KACC 23026]